MANSVDPDQTAPSGAVSSGSALFAQTYRAQYFYNSHSHSIFRCARYTNVPSFCTMIQDPNDACCRKPRCQYIAPTPAPNPNLTPSPQPGVSTLAPHPVSTQAPQPGVSTPTPQPGVATQAPTPSGQSTPAPNRSKQF